ncbi:MAG TPA: peptidylprolyl isomerase [Bacteroidota bacterium]|nr:peptidylprolyl isomerase [Bacteroidota bacterium]
MNKLLLVLLLAAGTRLAAQEVVADKIVAVVGKEPILLSDLNAQIEFYMLNKSIDTAAPGVRQQVLDAMVNEKLMLARAMEDTNVVVREEDVTSRLDELVAQRVQQVGSEKKLEEIYGMPVSKMKREFRDETKKQLMIQDLQQLKFGSLQPSRREVEEFFAQYKDSLPKVAEEVELYHLFITPKVSSTAKEQLRAKAQKVLDSIRAGGDFADFARRYSEDRATASSGGDLGTWRRGQFVSEFEEAVFALKDSAISNLVETSRGLHIIQLLQRRGESVHARQILFRVGLDSGGIRETKDFLRALRDSVLHHGVKFTDLAKRYSEDKESGPLGGYVGLFPFSQLEKSMQETVRDLKVGDISEPQEISSSTVSGYQIVYVTKRTPEHIMNLNDDWKRLEQLTTAYKRNEEYLKWIKQLRTEIYWDTRL